MAPLKTLFKLTSLIALVGWLMLVCLPFWPYTDELVLGLCVVVLAILYCWLLVDAMRQRPSRTAASPASSRWVGCCHCCANPPPHWQPGCISWRSI